MSQLRRADSHAAEIRVFKCFLKVVGDRECNWRLIVAGESPKLQGRRIEETRHPTVDIRVSRIN